MISYAQSCYVNFGTIQLPISKTQETRIARLMTMQYLSFDCMHLKFLPRHITLENRKIKSHLRFSLSTGVGSQAQEAHVNVQA